MKFAIIEKSPSSMTWTVLETVPMVGKGVQKHVRAMREDGREVSIVDIEYARQDPYIFWPGEGRKAPVRVSTFTDPATGKLIHCFETKVEG